MQFIDTKELKLPAIGFGTYKIKDKPIMFSSLDCAINSGYRLIDTASFYENEDMIGEYLTKNKDIIKREDIILCSKVWPSDFGYENTIKSIENSLKKLNTEYLDIAYLHWPGDDMTQSWKALIYCKEKGLIKHIAVSNFLEKHLDEIIKETNVIPVVNQLEIHPLNQAKETVAYCKKLSITPVAWSPIGRMSKEITENKVLIDLSNKYKKTIPQIILRWHIQKNIIAIPKSQTPDRIKENIDIFDFELEKEEIEKINSLDKNKSCSSNSPHDDNCLKKLRYGK